MAKINWVRVALGLALASNVITAGCMLYLVTSGHFEPRRHVSATIDQSSWELPLRVKIVER